VTRTVRTESETPHAFTDGVQLSARGSGIAAAALAHAILARDDQPATAHQIAAQTPAQLLPDIVGPLVKGHQESVEQLTAEHQQWRTAATEYATDMARARARAAARSHSRDSGLEI
jgi:hypothetical protein